MRIECPDVSRLSLPCAVADHRVSDADALVVDQRRERHLPFVVSHRLIRTWNSSPHEPLHVCIAARIRALELTWQL